MTLVPSKAMVPTLASPAKAQSLRTSTKRVSRPIQVHLAEVADGAEVGDVVTDDDAAGDVGLAAAHDLARGAGASGIAIQQQGDHHPGMERRLAPQFALVMGEDGGEVESRNRIEEEIDEVIFGKPVLGRGGKHVGLVGGPVAIGLAHRDNLASIG